MTGAADGAAGAAGVPETTGFTIPIIGAEELSGTTDELVTTEGVVTTTASDCSDAADSTLLMLPPSRQTDLPFDHLLKLIR